MVADAAEIRFLLFKRGLTQTALAQTISVSRATINSVCAGRSCSYKTLEKVACALGTDPRQLLLFDKNNCTVKDVQAGSLQQTTQLKDNTQTSSSSYHIKEVTVRPPPTNNYIEGQQ